MFYLVKVLIGRAVVSLDRPFDYYSEEDDIQEGMRVLVPFGHSESTVGFVLEPPIPIEMDVDSYNKEHGIRLAKILRRIDEEPLLNPSLIALAKKMSEYYACDLIKILNAFLPPALKPKDSALKKSHGRFIDYVLPVEKTEYPSLGKNEKALLERIQTKKDGVHLSSISAKASMKKLLEKGCLRIEKVPVSRIPEMVATSLRDFSLTTSQREAYDAILGEKEKVSLLKGVTGSGKTEIYLSLAKEFLKQGKGVLVLIPEIALTDQMSNRFYSFFQDTISLLNSSLSDSRRYEEYRRIVSGESKIVLGTRSAIFAPVQNLGLIIIDEEHSDTYKQDSVPYYDAITVARMRKEIEGAKVLLGSATPRIIDNARAEKGVFQSVPLSVRYAASQEKDLLLVDMSLPNAFDPQKSSLISKTLFEELEKTLARKEQAMVLINRRGYAPMFLCRDCHAVAVCPNCGIPLNYHKKYNELRCHHCGYRIMASEHVCPCGGKDFLSLGYGTERAYEDLVTFFPKAKIAVLSNSTMLHKEDVFRALNRVEDNIMKFDSILDSRIQQLNAPVSPTFTFDRLLEQLCRFNGNVIIQTMFLKGEVNGESVTNTTEHEVSGWLEALKQIRPKQVMIYTLDRETPIKNLRKVPKEELDAIAERVRKEGFDVTVSA